MSEQALATTDRWGRSAEPSFLHQAFRQVCHKWFRVEWEGLHHIPTQGGALLVANHAGMMPIDGGVISVGIEEQRGRRVYGLAHHGFFQVPFAGTLLGREGMVAAHPGNAHRLLHDDQHLVVVFPEGEKGPVKPPSELYRLQRFGRGGFVETAMRAGVPIVPIVLMGTEDATPVVARVKAAGQTIPITLNSLLLGPVVGAFAPLPVKIRAQVLPPLQWDDPPNLESYSRSVVMDRAEAIRAGMQDTLNVMLLNRKSVWAG
ncbi:MAG: 1-acyl-sn-glycerol-3-phosphate acyltransferase [Myxococcota bacterium]|jgi:1-acyl-sn-glycerol-3-phosphate acyltransferase